VTCKICESIKNSQLKIYEDKNIIAMLNDKPATAGHIIMTTKEHYPIFENIPDELVAHIFSVANKLSTITFETLGAHGTNIIVNNGLTAGQKDPHFLVHVIPRRENDNIDFGWQPKKASEDEFNEILSKLTGTMEVTPETPQEEVISEVKKEDGDNKDESGDSKDYLLDSLTRIP